ncbi:MAG: DinB family protein [Gemmatimonadota bacterium]
MRAEVDRIRDQLNRAFFGNSWHGDAIFDVLDTIPATVADRRPVEGAHTIHEIVLHTAVWLDVVSKRAGGASFESLTPDEDWPAADGSWPDALAELRAARDRLDALLAEMDDAELSRSIVGQRQSWSAYEDLHGTIQHALYHAGQIVILAKLGD